MICIIYFLGPRYRYNKGYSFTVTAMPYYRISFKFLYIFLLDFVNLTKLNCIHTDQYIINWFYIYY